MRLIDADSIPWLVEGVGEIPVITKEEIDQMPEAIIRCKDCRAFDEKRVLCKKNNMIAVREDDWCSRAERKEE